MQNKFFFFVIVIILLSCSNNDSENVIITENNIYTGNLILTSQQEISEFVNKGYSQVNGDLIIEDTNNPSTIEDLSIIKEIEIIEGDLIIQKNNLLQTISGFEKLIKTTGSIKIISNTQVTNINGFNNLIDVQENFNIGASQQGTNGYEILLNGFDNLKNVGGDFAASAIIGEINAFKSLNIVGGLFSIFGCKDITSLSNFESLEQINALWIQANNNLMNLNGLDKIKNIDGDERFEQRNLIITNPSLQNLNGLTNVEIVGGLTIDSNHNLQNLEGLTNLKQVTGKLKIYNNGTLESLSGLENVNNVYELSIVGNPNIIDLSGFESLQIIGNEAEPNRDGLFAIIGNGLSGFEKLKTLSGLENLTKVLVGTIRITSNTALENLDGLSNLESLFVSNQWHTSIEVKYNESLDNFCGLNKAIENNAIPDSSIVVINNKTIYWNLDPSLCK